MQLHLVFICVEVIDGVFSPVESLDEWHSELRWEGEVQYLVSEWGFSLLYQGIHRNWGSAFHGFFHMGELLLDILEAPLPQLVFPASSRWR